MVKFPLVLIAAPAVTPGRPEGLDATIAHLTPYYIDC